MKRIPEQPDNYTGGLKRFLSSLWVKMAVWFGLLFVVSITAFLAIELYGVPFLGVSGEYRQQQDEIFAHLNLVADLKKKLLVQWIKERKEDIKVYSKSSEISTNVLEIKSLIRDHAARNITGNALWKNIQDSKPYRSIQELMLLVKASCQAYENIQIADAQSGMIIFSLNSSDLGTNILKSRLFTDTVYSGDVFVSFEKDDAGEESHLFISKTIEAGNSLGAIRDYNTEVLIIIIDPNDFIKPLLHTGGGLGKSGEALLVSQEAKLLTSLKYSLPGGTLAEPLTYQTTDVPTMLAAQGEEGIISAKDYRGEPVLAAYRHIRITSEVGWGMVVKRDQAEVFASLQKSIIFSALTGLFGVILITILVFFIARNLSRPVHDLGKTVQQIEAGNFDIRAKVTTSGEIGNLARAFNSMIERIQNWHRDLENEVHIRTNDLSNANVKLQNEITGRKQVEEERMRLSTAIEQADETIVITDKDANIQYVNPAFEHITGYTSEEVIGQDINILRSDKHGESFYKEIWDAISQGEVWKGHFINKKKGGSLYDVAATISPIKNAKGDITNFVNIGRDVTEELKMEERLRQAQKMESIGTLAGGIAHDFNNILGVVLGYTELCLDDTAETTSNHRNLQEIFKAANRAKDLVQQILAFSRQTELGVKPIKISSVVKEVIRFISASLPKTIEIREDIMARHDIVMADSTQIHQVLMNLCTNAWHAMRAGAGVLEISLLEKNLSSEDVLSYPDLHEGSYLELSVSDTGHGIEKENLVRIFDPYFTTKGKGEGTGLGLSVIHGIVKSYGGEITVHSKPGEGTTFHVLLPLAGEAETSAEVKKSAPVPTGHERILFVDDEPGLVDSGKQLLERLGYTLVVRVSAVEALEAFRAQPEKFDLVITDKTMPNMTGYELAKELKTIRSDIPIILSTGFSDKADPEKLKAVGISNFIMKPIVKEEIAATIRKVLDNKKGE